MLSLQYYFLFIECMVPENKHCLDFFVDCVICQPHAVFLMKYFNVPEQLGEVGNVDIKDFCKW